ncbi:hypothetical protein T4B_50 [Trichinella pseudospiralis]|uniref:Uncharacterized protein n=1 Tax=Trichinella pseudospiralis TaxID=6337 RepID=A0A0V1GE90_TRIPS|nr:hypothetical protein T4B_50 [Trichinella pseudospiralis]
MLQQFCLKKAAMGLVKRMKQNWDRTTFDMTKCLYCFKLHFRFIAMGNCCHKKAEKPESAAM